MADSSTTKRVLIVEDERPMAQALKIKLDKSGFTTEIASNGEEALKIIDRSKFDIILLDLVMPRLDGFGVLEELKKNKVAIPVIVASNLGQETDIKRAVSLGAVDYFVKSDISIAEIIEKIKKALDL